MVPNQCYESVLMHHFDRLPTKRNADECNIRKACLLALLNVLLCFYLHERLLCRLSEGRVGFIICAFKLEKDRHFLGVFGQNGNVISAESAFTVGFNHVMLWR